MIGTRNRVAGFSATVSENGRTRPRTTALQHLKNPYSTVLHCSDGPPRPLLCLSSSPCLSSPPPPSGKYPTLPNGRCMQPCTLSPPLLFSHSNRSCCFASRHRRAFDSWTWPCSHRIGAHSQALAGGQRLGIVVEDSYTDAKCASTGHLHSSARRSELKHCPMVRQPRFTYVSTIVSPVANCSPGYWRPVTKVVEPPLPRAPPKRGARRSALDAPDHGQKGLWALAYKET